ncbi:hypothetical protein ARTHRO9AX_210154 [Arthrobacter sp. 9AX]|nr:hypothetical protein ARTHRO9AX_210154 [Arthrobacter sp. 9AX]
MPRQCFHSLPFVGPGWAPFPRRYPLAEKKVSKLMKVLSSRPAAPSVGGAGLPGPAE